MSVDQGDRTRVAFLTRYDERRASSRVRAYNYADPLSSLGVTSRFLPWASRPRRAWPAYLARALALARWADVVVLQKPFQPPWFVDALARLKPRLVVDVDDALWEPVDDGDAARAVEHARRLDHALRRATSAIAGSRYLASCLRDRSPGTDVHVLPSSVEMSRWPVHEHDDGDQDSIPVVGWIGSPENLADLAACRDALTDLVSSEVVRLRVVSSKPPALDVPAELVQWSAEQEPRQVAGFDIGIMPLRDTPRTRGRCGFKAVEYMAAGVPVVSSPLPGPSEVVDDGVTGYVVGNEAGWEQRLRQLAGDSGLRQQLGAAGRAAVADRYSIEANAPRLAEVLVAARDSERSAGSTRTRRAQR